MMNAHWSPTVPASRPAPANPTAVEPNEAIDRNEFAAASSSSLAISGIRLSCAGSKNCLTPAFTRSSRYSPGSAIASRPMTTAIERDEHRLDQAGPDHDPLPVVPVDVDAGQQPDEQARDGRDHQRQADCQRRLGLAPDVDARGQVRQRRAGGRHELGEPQQREVAFAEDREHRRGRRDGGGHRASWLVPAGVARSLPGAVLDRDAFAQEERPLEGQAFLARAPAVAAVAADRRRPRR